MDDLFQIIIYGIIIISFLSSFFKKKEQPKPPVPGTKPKDSVSYKPQSAGTQPTYSQQNQDEYDILKEIENLFKGEVNAPAPPKQTQPAAQDYYRDHEIKERNIESSEDERFYRDVQKRPSVENRLSLEESANLENRTNLERKTAIEQLSYAKARPKIDSKTEKDAEKFEMVLSALEKRSTKQNQFVRKIKNPVTVREYILFSEILGKPKALRR